jgi:hypothetical protein
MNTDQPWYHFTIPTDNAFSDKGHTYFSKILNEKNVKVIELFDFELVNTEWREEVCDRVSNDMTSMMLFYRPSNFQYPTAHIDLNTNIIKQTGTIHSPPAAINLIYNSNDDSEMIWYHTPELEFSDVKWTDADTAYIDFNPSELIECSKCCIGNNLTLVRTDIPHNVIMGNTPRLSVSIRFKWPGWKNPTWRGIVDQCSAYLNME